MKSKKRIKKHKCSLTTEEVVIGFLTIVKLPWPKFRAAKMHLAKKAGWGEEAQVQLEAAIGAFIENHKDSSSTELLKELIPFVRKQIRRLRSAPLAEPPKSV